MTELHLFVRGEASDPHDALDRATGPGTGWRANPAVHGVAADGGVRVWIVTGAGQIFHVWAQDWGPAAGLPGRRRPLSAWVDAGGRWVDAAGNAGPSFDATDAAAQPPAPEWGQHNPVRWL